MSKTKTINELTDEKYAELLNDACVMTIEHSVVITGNAYWYSEPGDTRLAENLAMTAIRLAQETGGDVLEAARIAWNAGISIAEGRA